jgi:hypothetical protein
MNGTTRACRWICAVLAAGWGLGGCAQLPPENEGPCLLVVEETGVVLAADLEGPEPSPGLLVARHPDGSFMSTTDLPGEVVAWTRGGTFDGRVAGPGPGPEEFGRVQALLTGTDGVHVFHEPGRWSRIGDAGRVHSLLSSGYLANVQEGSLVLLDDTTVVLGGPGMAGELRPWIVLEASGAIRDTLGFTEVEVGRLPPGIVLSDAGDRIWSGPFLGPGQAYELRMMEIDGSGAPPLRREAKFLPESTVGPLPSFGMQTLSRNTVFVRMLLPGAENGDEPGGHPYPAPSELLPRFDVVDLDRGSVLASGSRALAEDAGAFLVVGVFPDTGLGYRVREGPWGDRQIVILAVSLEPAQGSGEPERCAITDWVVTDGAG